jgi:hypothetical protein
MIPDYAPRRIPKTGHDTISDVVPDIGPDVGRSEAPDIEDHISFEALHSSSVSCINAR